MAFRSRRPIHIVAAHLALVTGVIHLTRWMLNWTQYASAGIVLPPDLRWPLFVVGPGTHHHGSTVSYLLAHVFAGPVE